MTQDASSFFALDHGTISLTASLIAPVDGRYRLLAASSAPRGIDTEAVLEDLAWRVARSDPALAGAMDDWPTWSRLQVGTWRAPRACLIAASSQTGDRLERAFLAAGWEVAARSFEARPDRVVLGEACLDLGLDAIVVAGREDADEAERSADRLLWPLAGSLGRMRDDVALIACGPFRERPEGIPEDRLFSLPEPAAVPATTASTLRDAASQVGAHLVGVDVTLADGRAGLRTSIASLAALLEEGVTGIDVGAAAGSRTLAGPDGEIGHAVFAAGAFLPEAILTDEGSAEAILAWSAVKGDPAARIDRLRELCLHPWSATDEEGTRLRLAALQAALQRQEAAWVSRSGPAGPDADVAAVSVLSGGGFSAVPTAGLALSLANTVRRPGAARILHDHARVLAPLGALPVEEDRRRLLGDLMADCLVPIGSVVMTGRPSRGGDGSMAITTELGADELRLEHDRLSLVDLPPGIAAKLEIDPDAGVLLGTAGQPVTLEVSGGLGGLLVDTRAIPLELPDTEEQRRRLLEEWERPVWAISP